LPIAITAEQLAIAESVGLWAKRAGSIAEVRDLESRDGRTASQDWRTANWRALAELGVFSIALPPALGGIGGCTADIAVVVEQLAAAIVPGPVMPTLLAELVLASAASTDDELLTAIGAGTASVAVALAPGDLVATTTEDGSLRVSGSTGPVLGAGDTSHLLLAARTEAGDGETWFVLDAETAAITPRTPVDFSRALGEVTLSDAAVPASQLLSGVRTANVRDLAALLAAAEASAVSAWCSQTAADYAKTRQQFGRPIGSFQAIKHLCAGMACRSEQATAIAWDAACCADDALGELPVSAATAAAMTLDAAVDNAKDAIQVLGGIGFTWEHDAHLYLRRALALRQLLGGSGPWRTRAAGLALDGQRRRPQATGKVKPEMLSKEKATSGLDDLRKDARLVATALSAVPPERRRKALAESGYVAPGWPRPYGLGAGPAELAVIDEELARVGVTRPELAIGNWAIPAIAKHGTSEQLARFAESTLRGEITWCQLFSEPEAGSDLASLRTRATAVDGGWSITGQKVWTSLAHQADWAICLARTDPAAPKHKGITYFLLPMRTGGVDIRPLREMTGRQMFNEVFLDDVFVPDDCVVGQPGDGWKIARTTLATERVAMVGGAGLSKDVEDLLDAAKAAGPALDPVVLDHIGARVAEGLTLSVMDDRLAEVTARATESGSESAAGSGPAVRKLLGVAHRQAVAETALTLHGVQSAAADGEAADAVAEFLLTRCLSIAGGTSQILLNLVAERVLGLPREEAR
jgi:alkylation response protein AidB-like acyl-CoA dehydrogenase